MPPGQYILIGVDFASPLSPDMAVYCYSMVTPATGEILIIGYESVRERMEREQREALTNTVIDIRKVKKAARVKHGPVPFRKYPVRS